MFSTCTVEITQYALNQRSPARSGKVKAKSFYKQHALKGRVFKIRIKNPV